MIKLYGSPMSSAGRCIWLLEEIGIPYECMEVSLRDPEARARYVAVVFAGGKVPYLVDGDFRLFESMAINLYLAARYKPEWLPADAQQRALVDQWSFWAISNLQPEALKVLGHTVHLPEDQRREQEAEAGRKGCSRFLAQLEGALRADYLLGDTFGLADLNCASVVRIALRAGIEPGPRVGAWMGRIQARPAFQKLYG
jgi:glutathione S-transferase